jgi:predicted dehydrogenase
VAQSPATHAPIGVGIVGLSAAGGWAARAHVPALAAVPGIELRALSASSAESAKAAGDKYGVALTYSSVEELAACDEVDLVAVTVKVTHHHELVMAALRAGKMVLCEWPMGATLAEAEQLAALASDGALRTVAGLQARSAPAIRYLRDLIADGYIGQVLSTTLVASGVNWGATVDSSRIYQLDRLGGGSMLAVPFGHTIDALAMVLGEFTEFTATTATRRPQVRNTDTGQTQAMTAEDQIAVTGMLDGGAVATVHFRGGLSCGTNFRWEINGADGDLVVTASPPILQIGQLTLQGAHGADAALSELVVPAEYELVPGLAGQSEKPAYNVAHAYTQLVGDIRDGTELTPDFAHGVRRHRLLDKIRQLGSG